MQPLNPRFAYYRPPDTHIQLASCLTCAPHLLALAQSPHLSLMALRSHSVHLSFSQYFPGLRIIKNYP